jgi:CDGSH-type Zn-finger protein
MEMSDRPADRVEIHVRPNGSLKIYGPVRLLDVDGQTYDLAPWRTHDARGERIKLCRCGRSQTQPFCDESHTRVGFFSEPRVIDEISSDTADRASVEPDDLD